MASFSVTSAFRGGLLLSMLIGLCLSGAVRAQPATAPQVVPVQQRPWLDARRTADERAALLLEAMTLAEKVGQMAQQNGIGGAPTGDVDERVVDSALYERVRQGQLGSILNETDIPTINAFQRVATAESRLGIPLIFGRDVIHGYRTIFPIPLGQAASWNPELVEAAAAVAAREARSVGIHWTFAPMVDIARDPRWGRIAEGFGEDPVLASRFSAAMVRGFQGDDLSAPDRVAACAKHFAGYGAAEGGRDYNTTVISPSLLRNIYLPPFQAAVDANVATLMSGFNDINGVPASANKYLLQDILREEWGFAGFVVSDWESIGEVLVHGYTEDLKSTALAAARAGVNMEMTSQAYHKYLVKLVEEGAISAAEIDKLVLPILRLKFQLGLFEQPYTKPAKPSRILTKDNLEVARRLARQSVVLLKNEKQTLPLEKAKLRKLAVIGPLADAKHEQLGTWVPDGRGADSRTPLMAFRESVGDKTEVLYAVGVGNGMTSDKSAIAEAVAAARNAEVVLLFVGEQASLSGEARSRAILDLPGAQNELVEAVAATGTPVVMVVFAGRPLAIGKQMAMADAVLYSLHAGTMAGPALADLIWGVESPSGKLPVTMPKAVGQIPLYYNHVNTGRPPKQYHFDKHRNVSERIDTELGYNSNYIDVSPYPLFPFGYGLSYTTFEYGQVELSAAKLRAGQTLAVRVPVTNNGEVAADEVVQLYVRDVAGSVTRPVRELKDFRRIHLEPNEALIVEFALPMDALAFYDNAEQRLLEPGTFEVYVGGSSLAPLAGEFEVVGGAED